MKIEDAAAIWRCSVGQARDRVQNHPELVTRDVRYEEVLLPDGRRCERIVADVELDEDRVRQLEPLDTVQPHVRTVRTGGLLGRFEVEEMPGHIPLTPEQRAEGWESQRALPVPHDDSEADWGSQDDEDRLDDEGIIEWQEERDAEDDGPWPEPDEEDSDISGQHVPAWAAWVAAVVIVGTALLVLDAKMQKWWQGRTLRMGLPAQGPDARQSQPQGLIVPQAPPRFWPRFGGVPLSPASRNRGKHRPAQLGTGQQTGPSPQPGLCPVCKTPGLRNTGCWACREYWSRR